MIALLDGMGLRNSAAARCIAAVTAAAFCLPAPCSTSLGCGAGVERCSMFRGCVGPLIHLCFFIKKQWLAIFSGAVMAAGL